MFDQINKIPADHGDRPEIYRDHLVRSYDRPALVQLLRNPEKETKKTKQRFIQELHRPPPSIVLPFLKSPIVNSFDISRVWYCVELTLERTGRA